MQVGKLMDREVGQRDEWRLLGNVLSQHPITTEKAVLGQPNVGAVNNES